MGVPTRVLPGRRSSGPKSGRPGKIGTAGNPSYWYRTRRSAIADCTARRVWHVKRACFLLGVGAFRPKFYWNGVIPCQNVDNVRQVVDRATTLPLEVSEHHFGKLLVTSVDGSLEAHGRLSIRVNWTFFAIYYGSGVMRRNVNSSAVFRGVDLFALKFYVDRGRPPSTILGVRKLETLGCPMLKTASFCFPSVWHNAGVWRSDKWTDRMICRIAYTAASKASFAARCRNWESFPKLAITCSLHLRTGTLFYNKFLSYL